MTPAWKEMYGLMLLLLVLVDVSIFMIRKSQSAKRKDDCGIKGGCRGAWRRAEFRFEIWREFVPHFRKSEVTIQAPNHTYSDIASQPLS